jgi:hypothetical protein
MVFALPSFPLLGFSTINKKCHIPLFYAFAPSFPLAFLFPQSLSFVRILSIPVKKGNYPAFS